MNGTEKAITIEVRNRARQICQARGKRNRMPTPKERSMMRRWADRLALYENWAQYLGANHGRKWWFRPVDRWLRRGI